eukprot:m.189607 g.189607  ORF g.189607 m.189607 type:complete len:198 (-) comp25669_c1_seq5:1488-2081(-)
MSDVDIDDLLDDAEMLLARPKQRQQQQPTKSRICHTKPKREDDLDDILHELDLGISPPPPEPTKTTAKSTPHRELSRTRLGSLSDKVKSDLVKCFPVYLGGTETPKGLNRGGPPTACNQLRCTSCDFRICIFDDYAWHERCDYLFFRNNVPDFDKLKVNLIKKPGCRAYACQCSWRSIESAVPLNQEKLKWVCAKHK